MTRMMHTNTLFLYNRLMRAAEDSLEGRGTSPHGVKSGWNSFMHSKLSTPNASQSLLS